MTKKHLMVFCKNFVKKNIIAFLKIRVESTFRSNVRRIEDLAQKEL